MANSRGHSNGFISPSIALKVGLILVSAVSLFFLVKLSLPHVSSLLSIALPQIWAVVSAWTAPPYLFITVHFIIFVIWKLSDHKPSREHMWAPHQDHQAVKPKQQQVSREISPEIQRSIPTRSDGWAAPSSQPVVFKHNISKVASPKISQEEPGHFQWAPREEPPLPSPKQRKSREISPKTSRNVSHRASPSDDSCLTEEKLEEKSTASSTSHLEMRRSERPVLAPEREFVRQERPVLAPERKYVRRVEPKPQESAVVEEGELEEDDSMDATWKAIMEKTPRPVVPTNSRAKEPEMSVGADEMNQRFEDFIRKSRNQIRLQVEEPNRHGRGLAMANAAF